MQKRKTSQKPKPTNGTRKRQVHKPRSDAKLQARSNKTALARISFFSKGERRLGDQPWWHHSGLPCRSQGCSWSQENPPLAHRNLLQTPFSLAVKQEPRWVEYPGGSLAWERGVMLRWKITEQEGQSEKCECELGSLEERQWGIPSWAAGFIRIVEQAWRCALISSVLFVFVTAARGCRGPSNLYHVLIVLGNGQGPAGGWVWENGLPWWTMVTSSKFWHARSSSSFTPKGKRNVVMLKQN